MEADPVASNPSNPVPAQSAGRVTVLERNRWWGSGLSAPAWVSGAILRLLVGAVIVVVAWRLVDKLSSLLILIFISIFLSFAIEPAVNSLEQRGVKRGLGTGLVFVAVLAATTIFGIAMGQVIADQITDLVDEAPDRIDSLEGWLQRNVDAEITLQELSDAVSESGEFRSRATELAGGLVGFGGQVILALFDIFTVALFTFYLVAEGPKFRRTICSLLPPERQKTVLEIWDIGTAKTGGYLVSRVVLALVAFVVHWIGFEVIGLRFALVMAIWVGLLSQFVPVIGTYVAAVLPILIALADRPITALWVAIFMIVWQQVENYLVAPRVTAQTMAVHPAVAFGSVIAGTALLGPIGALLALPVSATLQGFISSYAARYQVLVDVNTAGLLDEAADGAGRGAADDEAGRR